MFGERSEKTLREIDLEDVASTDVVDAFLDGGVVALPRKVAFKTAITFNLKSLRLRNRSSLLYQRFVKPELLMPLLRTFVQNLADHAQANFGPDGAVAPSF